MSLLNSSAAHQLSGCRQVSQVIHITSRIKHDKRPIHGATKKAGSYSASDAPEMRKNPELYSTLNLSKADAAQSPPPATAVATAASDEPLASAMIQTPSGTPLTHRPEILAPAGGWPQLKAAVENGADAVYFGLSDFNARARAANFDPEELPEVMLYLHDRDVKGYVVLNVLVFDEELQRMEQRVRQVAEAGVDAVIVQDVGVVELIRRVAPNLHVHGSTQMSITSAEGAEFAGNLGVSRVVVGRELSVREIAKLKRGTSAEVEAFVHGALCVSYSGQCFSSEAWGGRSANRGQCAQACRMPYGLIVNGELRDLQDMKYLLSPQDLMALTLVPELVAAGVSCFKIEGRLKGPEYVALTTQLYRQAVDAAWQGLQRQQQEQQQQQAGRSKGSAAAGGFELSQDMRWRLEQVFARGQDEEHRGLTPGFLAGVKHQELVRGRAPRHRGLYLGRVAAVTRQGVRLELAGPVKRGDGVVFDFGDPEAKEEGGKIYEVLDARGRPVAVPPGSLGVSRGPVELVFGGKGVGPDLHKVKVGDLVWKTKDDAIEASLRSSYEGLAASETRKVVVDLALQGGLGGSLAMTLSDGAGSTVTVRSSQPLAAASKRPASREDLLKAIGQLGDNALALGQVDMEGLGLEQGLFIPAGEVKAMRRSAVEQLMEQRRSRALQAASGLSLEPVLPALLSDIKGRSNEAQSLPSNQPSSSAIPSSSDADPAGEADEAAARSAGEASTSGRQGSAQSAQLRVLCRSPQQVLAACKLPWLPEVILDFLEVQGLKEACAAVRQAGKRVVVAMPRILKPDEQRLLQFYLKLGADALLLRGAGCLQQLMELGGTGAKVPGIEPPIPALEGDFSLNAANVITADLMLRSGLELVTPTHDLNAAQIAKLAQQLGGRAQRLEVILHQHLPIFHTEHCVFCRFLSEGNSYLDCGHPCEQNMVHLRDHQGLDHLVLADMGCRNTVFNAQAQSGLQQLAGLLRAGCSRYRVELVDEPAEYVEPLLQGYRDVLDGQRKAKDLWMWLATLPDANGRTHGLSSGSLEAFKERSSKSLRPSARR